MVKAKKNTTLIVALAVVAVLIIGSIIGFVAWSNANAATDQTNSGSRCGMSSGKGACQQKGSSSCGSVCTNDGNCPNVDCPNADCPNKPANETLSVQTMSVEDNAALCPYCGQICSGICLNGGICTNSGNGNCANGGTMTNGCGRNGNGNCGK